MRPFLVKIILSCLVLNIYATAFAKKRKSSPSKTEKTVPSLLLFQERRIDFGKIFRGQKIKKSFRFRNAGTESVGLQGVYTSCGCIVADFDKSRRYKGGEEGTFNIQFDSIDFLGPIEKVITVVTDEKQLKSIKLSLIGIVEEEISVMPPLLDFGNAPLEATPTQEIVLTAKTFKSLEIGQIKFNSTIADVTKKKVKDTQWIITAKLSGKLPRGFVKDLITIESNAEHLKEIPIPLRANVTGNITIDPTYLEFGGLFRDDPKEKSVTVRSNKPLKIIDTRVQLLKNEKLVPEAQKYILVTAKEKNAQEQTITIQLRFEKLSIDEYKKLKGNFHGKVILKTPDPAEKEIAINFYGLLDDEDNN